jgi:hypothetical protein
VTTFERDNLILYYYLRASEIWPYKRGDHSWERQFSGCITICAFEIWPDKRGGLWRVYCITISVHLKSGLIKEVAFGERWSYKRGTSVNCILTLGDKLHNQQQHPVLCYCCTSQLDMDLHVVILSSKGTNVPWGMVLGQMFQLDNSDQQDNWNKRTFLSGWCKIQQHTGSTLVILSHNMTL